jgi:uncharacterized phiE125 gp8 family phage protein
MWTEPVVTVPAANEPITLSEAKAHVRVTSSDHDAVLAVCIAAARDLAEQYTGIKLVTQTVTFSARHFRTVMDLPAAPLQSLSIQYLDTEKESQTLNPALYDISGVSTLRPTVSRADGASWPSLYNHPEAVTITAVVGYEAVPDAIRSALLLMIGHLFDNREAVNAETMSEVPMTTMALLENYRTFR